MRYKIYICLLLLLSSPVLMAQTTGPGGQPLHHTAAEGKTGAKLIRIADTLTAQEKTNRDPVILKTELDSLIDQYNSNRAQQVVGEPVREATANTYPYVLAGLFVIIALIGVVICLFFRHQLKINRAIARLYEKEKKGEVNPGNGIPAINKEKNSRGKTVMPSAEIRINELNEELYKLSKENEGLNRVIKEYNGIQHEYDSLRHGILKTYKVKNYPGYDKTKDEILAIQGVFKTENLVANYAYEKFVKPILAITDVNKNSPAKLSAADRDKLLDLLVSLSLLYIEYLYLRVNDLSIGGRMVERLQDLSKGNGPDISLLKKLNTEFGSRALVLKIALNKAELHQLSYPVFDETNLNNQ